MSNGEQPSNNPKSRRFKLGLVVGVAGVVIAVPASLFIVQNLFFSMGLGQYGLGGGNTANQGDSQVNAFLTSITARGSFLDKISSKADFEGIAGLADCTGTNDQCIEDTTPAVPTDISPKMCADVIAWASGLGVTEMSGPKDAGWISMASADPQAKCVEVLNGGLRWMPEGLASEDLLLQGQAGTPPMTFLVTIARTEKIEKPAGIGTTVWAKGKAPIPVYKPQYFYTVGVTTEKFGSNVNLSAQSASWQHQAAALLDIVATMRVTYPQYIDTDPTLTQFSLDFFNKRYQYGTKLVPIAAADGQVDWVDFTSNTGKRICLSIPGVRGAGDPLDDNSAGQYGLGGGNTAFQGLGKPVSGAKAEEPYGSYVLGGCDGVPQVPAHPERLINLLPAVATSGAGPEVPTSASQAKQEVCAAAQVVKSRIDWFQGQPQGSLATVTLNQGRQMNDWRDPRVYATYDAVTKFLKKQKPQDLMSLRQATSNLVSTAGYISQAGRQFVGRKTDQQFTFTNKTKNLAEYYNRAFNTPAGMNEVGSFRFVYAPLLTYCGIK
mgnify:CR=1 FL=1